ncbi:hypothetical protein HN011_006489 [Eciton burchellii]|nr:hypothetical protein HN011_006489 [Eciton burchellii]
MQQAIKLVDLFIHVPLNPGRNDCRYSATPSQPPLAGRLIRSQLSERYRTHFGRPRLILGTWQYFNDPLIRENGSALYQQRDDADIPVAIKKTKRQVSWKCLALRNEKYIAGFTRENNSKSNGDSTLKEQLKQRGISAQPDTHPTRGRALGFRDTANDHTEMNINATEPR